MSLGLIPATVFTNTPKELRHIALGCRVSRLPRESVQETHLPRMGYVQNDDRTPLGYTAGIVQTQGSSLCEQPWALRRNSYGVEDIYNSEQCQISSYRIAQVPPVGCSEPTGVTKSQEVGKSENA